MLRVMPDTYNPVSTSSSPAARPSTFRGKRISSKSTEWSESSERSVSPAHCHASGQDSVCVNNRQTGEADDSEPDITLHHDMNGPAVRLNQAARVRQSTFLCTERNIIFRASPCRESIHERCRTDHEESPPE